MFLNAVTKGDARTENGAISNSTTGSLIVDQFGKAGTYRGRSLNEVFADQSAIWGENALQALRLPFYLRMVTRKTRLLNDKETDKVQKGQGNRDESYKRLIWIAKYHPKTFYKNLWLLPIVGSWKDLWQLLVMDETLNKEEFFKVIMAGIDDDNQRDLVKKYLPRIRSNKKTKTEWAMKTNKLAKEFCLYVGWTAQMYRNFKASGVAHVFQREMCSRLYDNINFSLIPGRALTMLTKNLKGKGSFLSRHGLEKKYIDWLAKKPVAKFTGYVYELGKQVMEGTSFKNKGLSFIEKMTIDKQFEGLLELARKDQGGLKGNVWCALDTSGSMGCQVLPNNDLTAFQVCISLGIYFASLNEGAFNKNVVMFDTRSRMKQLRGSFTDMVQQITSTTTAWGGTNFQNVIDELIRVRRENPNIPLSDFPKTLLVVSDMQFNPTNNHQSNYQMAISKLNKVFPKEFTDEFKIVWWLCVGRGRDFPSTIDDAGTYLFSGFDGSIVTLLLGGETKVDKETGKTVQLTMQEMVEVALNQEILTQITL